jgi:hypothetical protein
MVEMQHNAATPMDLINFAGWIKAQRAVSTFLPAVPHGGYVLRTLSTLPDL